jgi:type IV pilus assembly protein PilY1
MITNGLPNESTLNPIPTKIGDADGDGYPGDGTPDEGTYGQGTHYSDDVAFYLNKKVDLTPDNGRTGDDITVHTVLAFSPSDDLIARTAAMGGGEYYNAYNANELAEALNALLIKIVAEEDTAFVAPVVPASTTNRTISSDRVYLGLFKPQIDEAWIGNIKKYRVTEGTQLLDSNGSPATDANTGDFIENSNSYWGTDGVDVDGNPLYIVCSDNPETPYVSGDGGLANCGGVGGTLTARNLLEANDSSDPYKGERFIYTYPPGSYIASNPSHPKDLTNALNRWSSSTAWLSTSILGVGVGTRTKDEIIDYVTGFDIDSTVADTQRSWLLGDVLHSRPVVFNYSSYTLDQENDCSVNSSVIYVGANDGMIHAFRDCDGREMWSFIPPQFLSQLKDTADGNHQYFADAPPVAYVHDTNNNGIIEALPDKTGDRVILVFGLRRGGSSDDLAYSGTWGGYLALDVSIPESPELVFSVDSSKTGLEEMGQSWSQPRLAKVRVGTESKIVAFVTGGYDKYEDLRYGQQQEFPTLGVDTTVPYQVGDSGVSVFNEGATSPGGVDVTVTKSPYNRGGAMYAIEIATLTGPVPSLTPDTSNAGAIIWSYDHDGPNSTNNNADLDYSIASDMTTGDLNNDGYTDVIYVGDTGGRMWRFTVGESDQSLWEGNIIFDANAGYKDFYTPYVDSNNRSEPQTPTEDTTDVGRKFFYRPAVAILNGKAHLWFGSGDRAHPLNRAVVDRLYKVVDNGQTTGSDINEKNLVDLTEDPLQSDKFNVVKVLSKLQNLADGPNGATEPDYYHGWMIKMNWDYESTATDKTSDVVGEKMLAAPVMFNGEAYYTTYAPLADAASSNPCSVGNLGTSRLYHLEAHTGEAIFNYDLTNDSDVLEDGSRAEAEDGSVLKRADRQRTLGQGIPSGIVTLIDASGRVTMMISSSNRVETYNAPDIKLISPVYWMQW